MKFTLALEFTFSSQQNQFIRNRKLSLLQVIMRLKENYNISKKCSGDIITVLPGDEKRTQRILKYVLLKSSLIMELRNILQQICLTRQLLSQCFKNYTFIAGL